MILNWLTAFPPRRISIKREADYNTHYIGHINDGRQFFGSYPFVFPNGVPTTAEWQKERKEYVVLYLFDQVGNFLEARHRYLGTTAEIGNLSNTKALEELIHQLGPFTYGDIKVKPFQTTIDGHVFGLVRYKFTVDLEPHSSISFRWPWNGEYDT